MSDAPRRRWASDWSSRCVLSSEKLMGFSPFSVNRPAVQIRSEPAPGNFETSNGVFLSD